MTNTKSKLIRKNGKVYARASATYYAFFIVEITE